MLFGIIGIFSAIICVGTDTHYFKAMGALGVLHFAAAITIRVMLSIMMDSWINNSTDILDSYRAFNDCVGPSMDLGMIENQFLDILNSMH